MYGARGRGEAVLRVSCGLGAGVKERNLFQPKT